MMAGLRGGTCGLNTGCIRLTILLSLFFAISDNGKTLDLAKQQTTATTDLESNRKMEALTLALAEKDQELSRLQEQVVLEQGRASVSGVSSARGT